MDRKAERRQRILETAARLFMEHGYAATSTAQIANAAGASKETLYSYFGGKAPILRQALTELVGTPGQMRPDVASATAEQLRQALLTMATDLMHDLMQPTYLALARIVVAETPRDPQLADLFRDAVAERALTAVADLLRSAQHTGLIAPGVTVSTAARAFVGPLLTYVLLDGLLRAPGSVRVPSTDVIGAQVDLFHQAVTSKKES